MMPTSLSDFTGEYREIGGAELLFRDCPVCGSTRFKTYVNQDTGKWYCHAGEHGAGGIVQVSESVDQARTRLRAKLHPPPRQRRVWKEINLPPWRPLTERALGYLAKRGINETDARRLALVDGDDEYLGRIIVPHFNVRGEVIYWTARSYASIAEGPKYKGAAGAKPIYIPEHGMGAGPFEQIVVVEGPFDAISVWQAGYVALAMGGKEMPRYMATDIWSSVAPDGEVVVMLDAAALQDSISLVGKMEGHVSSVRIVVPTRADPGDMEPGDVRMAIG